MIGGDKSDMWQPNTRIKTHPLKQRHHVIDKGKKITHRLTHEKI